MFLVSGLKWWVTVSVTNSSAYIGELATPFGMNTYESFEQDKKSDKI